MRDEATCSECDHKFPVIRYGRRIPCPWCGALLDVMPDDPPAGYPSREDWAQAIKAKITWLADAATELGQMRNTAGLLARVNEEITRLRDFLGTGGGVR